jgi:hypothetical protein
MNFEIEPTVGVRGLSMGSPKEIVRDFFGTEPKVFQRGPTDNSADYWATDGVFAYYDDEDKLEALEFASPAEARLNGTELVSANMQQATAFIASLDPAVTVNEGGASVRSSRLGVGIWCPVPHGRDAAVESVLVCGAGYFA